MLTASTVYTSTFDKIVFVYLCQWFWCPFGLLERDIMLIEYDITGILFRRFLNKNVFRTMFIQSSVDEQLANIRKSWENVSLVLYYLHCDVLRACSNLWTHSSVLPVTKGLKLLQTEPYGTEEISSEVLEQLFQVYW